MAGLLVLAMIGVARGREIYEVLRFAALYRECSAYAETLKSSRPDDVPPEVWDEENFGVGTALANVCFSTHHVPLAEMELFTADFRQQMSEPIDLTTIDWLWKRLADTGAHGEQYVGKWRPVWEESVSAARESALRRNPR
ncbi:hypothetical protein [Maioricimonas rarisocia]|nr:hypothetical protein [Maioricimonas rarisocia]